MKIKFDPKKHQVKANFRRYTSCQRRFLVKHVDKLLDMGSFIPNPNESWEAAPQLVPKESPANLERQLIFSKWSNNNISVTNDVYGNYGVDNGVIRFFWNQVLSFNRFCFGLLGDACAPGLLWIDWNRLHEMNLFLEASPSRFQKLNCVLDIISRTIVCRIERSHEVMDRWLQHTCTQWRRASAKHWQIYGDIRKSQPIYLSQKSLVLENKIKWCSQIIDGDGYKMDRENMEGLQNMHELIIAEQLSQLIHCSWWMSSVIPDFAARQPH